MQLERRTRRLKLVGCAHFETPIHVKRKANMFCESVGGYVAKVNFSFHRSRLDYFLPTEIPPSLASRNLSA